MITGGPDNGEQAAHEQGRALAEGVVEQDRHHAEGHRQTDDHREHHEHPLCAPVRTAGSRAG